MRGGYVSLVQQITSWPMLRLRQRRQNVRLFASYPSPAINLPRPVFDTDFYTNSRNRDAIHANIISRKGQGDIDKVLRLSQQLTDSSGGTDTNVASLREELNAELFRLPNMSHPAVRGLSEPRVVHTRPFSHPGGSEGAYPLRKFEEIARILGGARLANLGLVCGERSYYLTGPLAELELALVNWAVEKLLQEAGTELFNSTYSTGTVLHINFLCFKS
jgi:seryl-tRNA synthetase